MVFKFAALAATVSIQLLFSAHATAADLSISCLKLNPFRQTEATYEACKASLNVGDKSDSEEAKLHAQLGEAYYWAARYDLAIDSFNTALSLDKSLLETRIQRGWAFYRTNEISRSFQDFSDAIEENPNSGRAIFGIGFLYGMAGDREKQTAAYLQAISASPKYYLARSSLASLYSENHGESALALEQFNILISKGEEELNTVQFFTQGAVFPTLDFYASIRFKRSEVLLSERRYEEALQDADWLISQYPDDFAPMARKAEIFNEQRKYDTAQQFAQDAHKTCLEKTPNYQCDFSGSVVIDSLLGLKKYKEAASIGQALLSSQRGGMYMPRAVYLAGVALKNVGEIDEARRLLLMVIESTNYRSAALTQFQQNGFYDGSVQDEMSESVVNGLDACLLDDECMGQ